MTARPKIICSNCRRSVAPVSQKIDREQERRLVELFCDGSCLSPSDTDDDTALLRELQELGYIEGKHFVR